MKNEMFILGLLALTSYFMPGESHYKSRSSRFPARKYPQAPNNYPRYPRPHYSYIFIPNSPKFSKNNQWHKMCPPGTTIMLIGRHFRCVPNNQFISDKTKPNAITPAPTNITTTNATTPATTTNATTPATTTNATTPATTTNATTPATTTNATTPATTTNATTPATTTISTTTNSANSTSSTTTSTTIQTTTPTFAERFWKMFQQLFGLKK
ncbi:mucin-7 [Mus caroli]|uniref:Mucin-7 n=1 Tax=Mus caroli TaxID=10089 RepID=A0A6P5PNG7_MUSCR|nr:mucin-7 [Mus caroli]